MSTGIQKILVANRGEIARRIMRTCREMGIATVAVFSDVDEDFPFVREADQAVRIGPGPSSESYLVIEKIIDAAKRTGADAIHPGYGFLAENAGFAEACAEADIIFIGPSPEAIASMGSKRAAKALVSEAGVPVIPGYDGADQDPAVLSAEAEKIGFPVLLKASAGGGGKGMRIVHESAELADAIVSARREAESSFGDGTLLVEKYVERPRHIELQILGDVHGNVVHLFERECSIQRRHQKIVEEAPSPGISPELRERMGRAAIRAAEAIGYSNAGTVEFIVAPNGEFYFLEVNTRLQVEHPVTECITGIDLVREQIHVAEGAPLAFSQKDLDIDGAAIEVRIYAEDPAQGFLPDTGRVADWSLAERVGVRVDSGVETGTVVGIHYDPMLAKVIAHGGDRREALQRMRAALRDLSVQGLKTNRAYLQKILDHEHFVEGKLHTHFIDDLGDELRVVPDEAALKVAMMTATALAATRRIASRSGVAKALAGFRNSPSAAESQRFVHEGEPYTVSYTRIGPDEFRCEIGEESGGVRLGVRDGARISVEIDGHRDWVRVIEVESTSYVQVRGASFRLEREPRFTDASASAMAGGCIAPMPGKIVTLEVQVGDSVKAGDVILTMEAMKMEHRVCAAEDGVVETIRVSVGDQVDADAVLAVIDAEG